MRRTSARRPFPDAFGGSWIVAHRGVHGAAPDGSFAPENSMGAFLRAEKLGLPVELDVRLLRDGTLVVFHDECLARMTGHARRVDEITREDLRRLRLRGPSGETHEAIPTLGDVLGGTKGGVLIELKTACRGAAPLVEAALRELARHARARDRFILQSFDAGAVGGVGERDGQVFRCQLIGRGAGSLRPVRFARAIAARSRPHAVAVPLDWTSRAATKAWRNQGYGVLAWTGKRSRDLRRGARLGLDRLISDFVPECAVAPEDARWLR